MTDVHESYVERRRWRIWPIVLLVLVALFGIGTLVAMIMNIHGSITWPAGEVKFGFWASVKESLRGTEQDFTEGSLNRAVGLLAVPMVVEMLGESLFAVTDAFWVARLGPDALAAVGLTESMLEIVYAVAIGLAMSTTAVVARRIGEKDERGAARASVQSIAIGVLFSLALGAVGAIYAPELLGLMGASASTVAAGAAYTRVLYAGMVTVLLLFLNNAIYRGAGDATTAMRALWIANGINLVVDPCLIFGLGPFPEMGLVGAAYGTLVGRTVGVLYQLWGFHKGTRLRIERKDLSVDGSVIKSLLRLSAGGVGQLLVATGSYVVLIRLLAGFGSAVLAGYVVAIRVVIFIILPAWGLSNAAATLVGQNLGAAKPDRAEKSVWITGLANMVFLGIVAIVFIFLAEPVIAIFTSDPDVVSYGVACLRYISYGYIFYAYGMVIGQAVNGAGDTRTPTWLNFACFWVWELPLAYGLAYWAGFGPEGVFFAITIAFSTFAVASVVLFRRGK
jgi:putative MATE family efflux protein